MRFLLRTNWKWRALNSRALSNSIHFSMCASLSNARQAVVSRSFVRYWWMPCILACSTAIVNPHGFRCLHTIRSGCSAAIWPTHTGNGCYCTNGCCTGSVVPAYTHIHSHSDSYNRYSMVETTSNEANIQRLKLKHMDSGLCEYSKTWTHRTILLLLFSIFSASSSFYAIWNAVHCARYTEPTCY